MSPKQLTQLITTAGQFHDVGKLTDAETLYRQILAQDPKRVEAMSGLGLVLSQQSRHEEALKYLPWRTVWESDSPLLLTALGSSMLAMGGVDGAVECANRAGELNPQFAQAWNLLGCALLARGDAQAAIVALFKALQAQPKYSDAFYNLGCTLLHIGLHTAAADAFGRALAIFPRHAKAFLNRGFALREMGLLDQAVASFSQALLVHAEFPEALHNLGTTLAEKGRVHEGLEWIRRAMAVNPHNYHAHSALIYLMNFDPAATTAEMAAEAAKWNARHAAALVPEAATFKNNRQAERRLRIGYVSPDFRGHAESWFLLPLFAAHDRQAFEVICYSSVRRPDSVTDKIRGLADVWQDVRGLSDAQLAEKIRADDIDILVDLTMHMEDHRLLTFARRPAPVQMAWLAYPAGTGLRAMDYRITDGTLLPADAASEYPERPVRLPHAWFCFQPTADAPALVVPPCMTSQSITFGSLNTFRKMSPQVIALWADTLAAVEKAGRQTALIVSCPEGDHRAGLLAGFAARGIGAEKIRLVSRLKYEEYLATYQQIDIALDPFPHNGATTTCEALWMGVPVLTLEGLTEAARLGSSILTTVGLADWIARTPEEFMAKAVAFSQHASALATLREQMRDRLRASPLLDAQGFARDLESAYRLAWHTWCSQNS